MLAIVRFSVWSNSQVARDLDAETVESLYIILKYFKVFKSSISIALSNKPTCIDQQEA